MNHFYRYSGYQSLGDFHYLSKEGSLKNYEYREWYTLASKIVSINFHDLQSDNSGTIGNIKGRFYFRSAYRNEPDFQIQVMQKQNDPTQSFRLSSLIQNDQTVSSNYQRLIANTISGIYDKENDSKSVAMLRDELTGKIRESIRRVFGDLEFSSLGDPLINGNFYFSKGTTQNFNYQNLSAGEKSAFDLILDMVVQSKYYPDAVYCIDEPELHMHTKLQGKVLRELYQLIPMKSQLWISTHSIGMLQEAEDIEKENPGSVVFLDFGNRDFDTDQLIQPSRIGKAVMDKFYELAFGDFSKLLLPKIIVFCEGSSNGNNRKDFDKTIYSTIFADTYPEAYFLSAGACTNIENIEETSGSIIRTLLNGVKVIKLIDRDDRSEQEVEELSAKGIRVLSRRNLESYLLDDSVIKKLCESVGKSEEYDACIEAKRKALRTACEKNGAMDDYKYARGIMYVEIKKRLRLTRCGNNADTFIRDTLAPLISPGMEVYKSLEADIFGATKEGSD